MATQRTARIVASAHLNTEVKLIDLALPQGESLNFTGGQYVIVNTNIQLPGGKIAKRAYSILSGDADQTKFQIAVKKVGEGPGSNYMHETKVGSQLPFSGPWGKFMVDDSTATNSTWVIATDTGITSALGLIQSARFRAQVQNPLLVWFVESPDYFIPESFVKSCVSPCGVNLDVRIIPPVNQPDRFRTAQEVLKTLLERSAGNFAP